ncbi:cyclic lactone autoinducer peptide [Cohnella silvisoli]|uniref:Cyclic lactone autoinducer peptide n=1 Tax=Cohnella silvisoli TaxID=2873699 RepID=A0ABV1KU29_9BACL|nr:cyclic lactone autoinducer peptide [Cohnella silvisoli]MCD9022951.1 cyclic lactone autoinducer peptide [Cohnella silvisoli]
MKKRAALIIGKALALFAVVFVSTASMLWFHRPEIPAELKK